MRKIRRERGSHSTHVSTQLPGRYICYCAGLFSDLFKRTSQAVSEIGERSSWEGRKRVKVVFSGVCMVVCKVNLSQEQSSF